jgi:hypothetical protein
MAGRKLWMVGVCAGWATGLAAGQSASITVDCAGAVIPSGGSTASDVVRTSAGMIQPATGYQFSFNPMVYGTGLLGILAVGGSASNPKPLGDVLNSFFVGGQRTLYGAMRNPSGTLPTLLDTEPVSGTFSGITVSLTFKQELLGNGFGRASITNIAKPSGLGITVQSGGAVFTVWSPPPPTVSEWQFEGNLQSVKQSGLAPTSGPGRIRYLDDAAFGPILGGVGAENEYPATPTPHGITDAQSDFGTTASFGLPTIGGVVDSVYRTSPCRNLSDPASSAKSRGIGLTLWPNTRDYWPDDRIGQWTMVWDLLIPQASWEAARIANTPCVALVEDSQNNNSVADAIIRITGAAPGAASVGHSVEQVGNATVLTPAIQPDQWFRLALVVDHYGARQGRVYVNGTLAGTTGSDWVYNAVKSADPRWGDISSGNPNGTSIDAAAWNGWGQFPSPWAKQTVAPNAPTASTASLFADITGKGESVFVANYLFTDHAMTDAQILALGSPNARGIVHLRPAPCRADFNGVGGVTVQDIFDFLAAYFAGAPSADFNGSGGITVQDIFDFLAAYFAGGA